MGKPTTNSARIGNMSKHKSARQQISLHVQKATEFSNPALFCSCGFPSALHITVVRSVE